MFLQLAADLEIKVQPWLCCGGQAALLDPPDTCFSTAFGNFLLLKEADAISRNSCWTVLVSRSKEKSLTTHRLGTSPLPPREWS